ncbi:MAG: UPF0149 family protein [Gammaproteobacteria bacterium]|nr:UPF0149 family protein [Gammaproteobacteria bacterium]
MTKHQEYISDEDLDFLDNFLLYRIDEDAVKEGDDEGILCVSELDGLLTAVVSGPGLIPPSQWLPEVWGDFEPVWESEAELRKVMTLMMSMMNSAAATLMESPEEFEPIFEYREIDGKEYPIVDEWCEGYMRGVALAQELWNSAGQEMEKLLNPIKGFTESSNWWAHELATETEVANVRNAITPNARAIHAFWLKRREHLRPGNSTVRRDSPRIGRNDPCPCGSGKKYKKCCLH